MKNPPESLRLSALAAFVFTISSLFIACGGGGHHPGGAGSGWVPGGGGADPGINPGGGIEPGMHPVRCEGRVVFRNARNRMEGLPNIKVLARNPSGVITSSTFTGPDGQYSLHLDTEMVNHIEAHYAGYTFLPTDLRMRPRGPESIADIVGTRVRFDVPGAGVNVPDPVGVGGGVVGSPGLTGTISGSILEVRRENGREVPVRDGVLRAEILVLDQSNNQLAVIQTDGGNRFSYTGRAGTQVILRPRPRQDVRWRTESIFGTLKSVPGNNPISFVYERVGASGSVAQPEFRAVVDVFYEDRYAPAGGLRGVSNVQVDFINLSGNNIATRVPTNSNGRASVPSREGDRWSIRLVGRPGMQSSPDQVHYIAERNAPRVPRIFVTTQAPQTSASRPSLRPVSALPTATQRPKYPNLFPRRPVSQP